MGNSDYLIWGMMRINIGARLRAERNARNLSQADMERRTGVPRCRISWLENGRAVPTIETLEKIADALEIPLCRLLSEGNEPAQAAKMPNGRANGSRRQGRKNDVRLLGELREHLGRMGEDDQNLLLFIARKNGRPGAKGIRARRSGGRQRRARSNNEFGNGRWQFMRAVVGNRYIRALGNAIPWEAHFHSPRPPRGTQMDLRCPKCGSADLKKVSLAYGEGLSRIKTKGRLRGLLFGEDGPNVIVGTAVMKGMYQTELSRALRPPKKWSYGKLLLWAGIVSVISLIFFTNTVMLSSSMVSALPFVAFGLIGLGVLIASVAVIWWHNQFVYPRQHAEWDRSFVCQRCGGVSHQPPQEEKRSRP
jgi:transcriptional regulator with XRE-family HTH domain